MAISSSSTGLRPGVCTSTTRPTNPYTGMVIMETDTGYLRVWDGSAWDYLSQSQNGTTNLPISDIGKAWTSWTPTLTQGTTTFSTSARSSSRYVQINKLVIAVGAVTINSGTGQSGQPLAISLPVAPYVTVYNMFGGAWIYDASTATAYNSSVYGISGTSTVGFLGDWSGGNSWGNTPSIQATTSDEVRAYFVYEAA